jgi:hypothetical protein
VPCKQQIKTTNKTEDNIEALQHTYQSILKRL